jgi:recombination protein RecT
MEEFKKELVVQESMIAEVLPQHLSIEKFKRAALIAVTNNPNILKADRQSLFTSLQRCAVDGLVPDNKEAALIEFNTKVNNSYVKKIQYLPMIDGVLKRARQSGEISTITARAVYTNDTFDYWVDEDGEHLNHRPNFLGDRGAMSLVYAMAKLKSGEAIVEPMSMADIEKVRGASKTGDKGPWKDWFERMALKSAMHRLARRLPNSSEIMEMLDQGNFMYDFSNKNEKELNTLNTGQAVNSYSTEDFESKLPQWKSLIEAGTKTSEQIIAFVEKKGAKLSDEQQKTLNSIGE